MPPPKKEKPESKRKSNQSKPQNIYNPQGMVGTNFGRVINNFIHNIDEKILKRLGLEQRVGFFLLGVLIIGGVTALYYGLKTNEKRVMTGEFRIAVISFYEDGDNLRDDIGYTIASGIFLRLKDDLQEIAVGPKVEIWGPDELNQTIAGETSLERAEKAEILAKEIQAHMVIYGVVEENEDGMQVVPEFYLDTQGFHEGSEVIGQYVGSPFSLPGSDNPSWQYNFDKQMQLRADIISSFAKGLTYFAVHEYGEALDTLQSIEEIDGWQDDEGREVLYALIGFAAGKAEDYELTEASLERAIEINPEYARPYIGLANLSYIRALKPFESSQDVNSVDQVLLDKCFEYLDLAVQAPDKPPLAEVETKIHFARGQCYWLKTFTGKLPDFNLAVAEFRQVIDAYDDGSNPRVYEFAGESYARLGLIYRLTGQLSEAAEYYQKAVEILADIPERRSIYQKRLDEINKALIPATP
ncbi:MAG: tetratricopeptide repeat protein [Anaerolineales bacterium]|nr:tetratricopeptide repeat protein [Anaerolineales bacterium]